MEKITTEILAIAIKNGLNFSELSENYLEYMTNDMMKEYEHRINWHLASRKPSYAVILKHHNNLDVNTYSLLGLKGFSEEQLLNLHSKGLINWSLASSNENIPWTMNLINTFRDSIDLTNISLMGIHHFTDEMIAKFDKDINWNSVSSNPYFKWTLELLDKKKELINWEALSRHSIQNIPTSALSKYENEISWFYASSNENFKIPDSILKNPIYKNKINWDYELAKYK